jgi:hypothetical protein
MRTRWLYAGAVALLALTSGTAMAQGRGNGRGQDKAQNRGQAKKADRQAAARFADHDRTVANNWAYHNRRALPPGLRASDRLPPDQQARLRPGYVIDQDMRARVYEAPVVLVRTFQPAPYGYRYVVYGGQVVLVDDGYRVADVISLTISF